MTNDYRPIHFGKGAGDRSRNRLTFLNQGLMQGPLTY